MKTKPSAVVIAGIVVGLLVYALAGYFLLVSPQRAKGAQLKQETAATQQQIAQYRALAAQARATPPIRVADLFRLTKAMPDDVDMAGVVLELSRIARESGIEFDSITPQGPGALSGYSSIPITLEFDGNYYELSDFLFRLRNLVRVRTGRLDAQGRLFLVDSISFSESAKSFPRIKASLAVHTFVYGDVAATTPTTAPATTTTGTTTTTTTTTPGATTTTPAANTPPAGASATGAGVP
ncbi:MAG: type 4a pilus biogenesis protein PilO [Actinomycetota bacterium]|nr:type 4a pilus biogenesis protein PilO [Actinomycetota bacterium]